MGRGRTNTWLRGAGAMMAIALLTGCQGGGDGSPATAVSTDRPMVDRTAANLYSWGTGGAGQQMEFYEELERRPIVSQDDAVHAVLLFAAGTSANTYEGRLAAAKARGWLSPSYNRPAREAVTVGEVSQMLARALRLKGAASPEQATGELKRSELIPETAESFHGLTGAQMLSLLSAAQDTYGSAMASRGREHSTAVASVEPVAARPATATATPPPVPQPQAVQPTPAPAAAPAVAAATEEPPKKMESIEDFLVASPAPAAAPAQTPSPAPAPSEPVVKVVRVNSSDSPRPMSEPLPELKRSSAVKAEALTPVTASSVAVPAPSPAPAAPVAAAATPQTPPPAPVAEPKVEASTQVGVPKAGTWKGGKALKRKQVDLPSEVRTSKP